MPTFYLIWSIEHAAWWRPGRMGYTREFALAGVYPEAEARAIVEDANVGGRLCHECLIPVDCLASPKERSE